MGLDSHASGRSFALDAAEQLSVDGLRQLQLDRLHAILAHTYANSAPYRAKCQAAQVHPDDLNALDDLARFPFTEKSDFRDNYPFGLFCVPPERLARIHASSGTTGKPAVVGYTARDLETWSGLVARSLRMAGARPGDRVHNAYNYGLFTGGLGSHDGAQALGVTVIPASGGQTERQVRLLVDLKPTIIMVTPSYLLNIADEFDRQGLRHSDIALRTALVGAEPWTEAMRAEINTRLNLKAVDYYGISEIIGPGVASESIETLDGPTLWEDHFYPEIIDPETGAVLPEGEWGELVLTTLTKEALPVIRYRTRDITRLLPGTARAMRRLDRFAGRSDDMMIVRGVNVFPSQIEEQILAIPQLSGHFHVDLTRDGALDNVTVRVELRQGAVQGEIQRIGRDLSRRIKTMIGISAQVDVVEIGSIKRSEGKAARVSDHRKLR